MGTVGGAFREHLTEIWAGGVASLLLSRISPSQSPGNQGAYRLGRPGDILS